MKRGDDRRAAQMVRIADTINRNPVAAHRHLGNFIYVVFTAGWIVGFVVGAVLL